MQVKLRAHSYSVTPLDQMSTLNPEKVSMPLAISGGWNAGVPWLVWQVSSLAKESIACKSQSNITTVIISNQCTSDYCLLLSSAHILTISLTLTSVSSQKYLCNT